MTAEAYQAIASCAARKIEQEWDCTDAERAVLSLINECSYAVGQSLALIPKLADFVEVTNLHKSTISRAIRSASKKGYLMIVKHRGETLYSIATETPGNQATPDGQAREAARQRLIEMNRGRLQGQADANGQQRLPGIFESEELQAPVRAFDALMQDPPAAPDPEPAPAPPRTVAAPMTEPPTEVESRLSRLQESMAAARGDHPSPSRPPNAPNAQNAKETKRKTEWHAAIRGLKGDSLYAMEQLMEECKAVGETEVQALLQYRFSWRGKAQRHPRLMAESVGVCKAMRLEGKGPAKPGAFVHRTLQTSLDFASGP